MASNDEQLEMRAWIDERALGRLIDSRFGSGAERAVIELVRCLARQGVGELHRTERFRTDGTRIGPDLKVPLETAALVLEIITAAHLAGLRAIARREAGLPLRHVRMDDVLELLMRAGSDPPIS